MDARARTAINSTIDSKAFAASTMSCQTAYQLWEELKPTEAYTEEDVQRSLDKVRIELCSSDMELCERMHNVVNKVAFILPRELKQYETRVVKAALFNLKQTKHKLRFLDLIVHMSRSDTPQTVKEFEGQYLKIIKEEKEVEEHNHDNKSSRQAAYNTTTNQGDKSDKECYYCHKKGHVEKQCFKKQREQGGEGKDKGKGKGKDGKSSSVSESEGSRKRKGGKKTAEILADQMCCIKHLWGKCDKNDCPHARRDAPTKGIVEHNFYKACVDKWGPPKAGNNVAGAGNA